MHHGHVTRAIISSYQPLGGYLLKPRTLHQFPNFLLGSTPIWAVSLEHKPGDEAMQGVDHWTEHENKMKISWNRLKPLRDPKSIWLQQTCFPRMNLEWLWLINAQKAGWSELMILYCLMQHFHALSWSVGVPVLTHIIHICYASSLNWSASRATIKWASNLYHVDRVCVCKLKVTFVTLVFATQRNEHEFIPKRNIRTKSRA